MKKLSLCIVLAISCTAPAGVVMYARWLNKHVRPQTAEAQHLHSWGLWSAPSKDGESWVQNRACTNCGFAEIRLVAVTK